MTTHGARRLSQVLCCSATLLGLFTAGVTHASDTLWPTKPVKLIVPFAPGGGGDTIARLWANCAATQLGQPVVVENRGGANGITGVQALKQSPADGYTLFLAGMSQMTITPYIFREPPYTPHTDFDGASLLVSSPYVLTASAASGITQFADIATTAQQRPDGLNFGSAGTGSPAHLMSALLSDALKVNFTHVPFAGEAAALTSLAGGQIDLAPFIAGPALPHIQSGKITALAVLGEQRLPELPEVPTIQELVGADELAYGSWTAIVFATGVPQDIVTRTHAITQTCLQQPELLTRLNAMHANPILAPASEVMAYTQRDTALWQPLIERLGVRNH